MNRAERLTHILEYLKRGMSFSINGIAKKYGVSGRTVFRDIKTLKMLGYDVNFDNGYKLVDLSQIYLIAKLSGLQLELISFALKTHPLRYILPLNELSDKISDSVSDRWQNGFFKTLNQKGFSFNQSFSSKTNKEEAKLTSFINAAEQNKCVQIKTKSGKFNRKLSPAGIIFGLTGIQLLVRDDSHSAQVKIPLNDVQSIKIIKSDFPVAHSK